MLGLHFRSRRAGEIPSDGIFLWQNMLYVVLRETSEYEQDEYMQGKISVRRIATGWTNNPHSRWQFASGAEPFQDDCFVWELIFDQEEAALPMPTHTIRAGESFDLKVNGGHFNIECTADDFTIVAHDGRVIHTHAIR